MSQNYIKLYSQSSKPDKAYFLNQGKVFFYITDMDKYSINGKNLIIGATELIMEHYHETSANRIETAITNKNSTLKVMPREKFIMGMKSSSFLLNVSMVLAKQVLLTNNIIHRNINELTGEQNRERELLIEYFKSFLNDCFKRQGSIAFNIKYVFIFLAIRLNCVFWTV